MESSNSSIQLWFLQVSFSTSTTKQVIQRRSTARGGMDLGWWSILHPQAKLINHYNPLLLYQIKVTKLGSSWCHFCTRLVAVLICTWSIGCFRIIIPRWSYKTLKKCEHLWLQVQKIVTKISHCYEGQCLQQFKDGIGKWKNLKQTR